MNTSLELEDVEAEAVDEVSDGPLSWRQTSALAVDSSSDGDKPSNGGKSTSV